MLKLFNGEENKIINMVSSLCLNDEKYKYFYMSPYVSFEMEPYKDTWNGIRFISKKDDVEVGYIDFRFDRNALSAEIAFIRFPLEDGILKEYLGVIRIEFILDVIDAINKVFSMGFNKITANVAIENERCHKFLNKHILKEFPKNTQPIIIPEDKRLIDGKLHDMVMYNIFNPSHDVLNIREIKSEFFLKIDRIKNG